MNRRLALSVGTFAALALSMSIVSPALAVHDPQVTGCTPETAVCKPSCDNATEITESTCIGSKPSNWVCCMPAANLPAGSGGCPTAGDTCQEKSQSSTCPSGSTDTGETCLAGNGICCRAAAASSTASTAPKTITLTDPLGGIGILGALNRIINTFLGIIGAVALLVFVYSGVVYMTAGGSGERVKSAVDTMKYAIIGLALIVFSYAIVSFYFQSLTAAAT